MICENCRIETIKIKDEWISVWSNYEGEYIYFCCLDCYNGWLSSWEVW